jgi:hypothetical protein
VAGQLGERRIVVAVIAKVGITNRVFVGSSAVEGADRDEALRLGHSGRRTQKQRINQAIDRCLSTNRQTEGQHGSDGQARTASQRPQTVAEILEHAGLTFLPDFWFS